jgi:hypothetical protein
VRLRLAPSLPFSRTDAVDALYGTYPVGYHTSTTCRHQSPLDRHRKSESIPVLVAVHPLPCSSHSPSYFMQFARPVLCEHGSLLGPFASAYSSPRQAETAKLSRSPLTFNCEPSIEDIITVRHDTWNSQSCAQLLIRREKGKDICAL